MNTRTLITLSLSAAVLGGTMVGCTTSYGAVASAAANGQAANGREAARAAERAEHAIAKKQGGRAVADAERAVALAPADARYRALLGQAYLTAGRFSSAAIAFQDTLALDPTNGRAALNLVLAQTALGDWATARATLDSHAALIAPADRGLALALAGDPAGGVAALTSVARERDASPTTRQNLALALALAGRWPEATAVAAIDMPGDQLDKRIMEWAAFARPTRPSDQVAALLGVVAVADAGMPAALALSDAPAAVPQAAAVEQALAAVDPAPTPPEAPAMTVAAVEQSAPAAPAGPAITFAALREVVQPVAPPATSRTAPIATPRRSAAVARSVDRAMAAAAPRSFAPGGYFVQLGAYDSSGVARDAWNRTARAVPALARLTPAGGSAVVNGATFYRLSVGGFARSDATALCGRVRRAGGDCFVRESLGDQVASWARGAQFAAR